MNMTHTVKRHLIPYNSRAYQYLKIEVWIKGTPFPKSAHNLFAQSEFRRGFVKINHARSVFRNERCARVY